MIQEAKERQTLIQTNLDDVERVYQIKTLIMEEKYSLEESYNAGSSLLDTSKMHEAYLSFDNLNEEANLIKEEENQEEEQKETNL